MDQTSIIQTRLMNIRVFGQVLIYQPTGQIVSRFKRKNDGTDTSISISLLLKKRKQLVHRQKKKKLTYVSVLIRDMIFLGEGIFFGPEEL